MSTVGAGPDGADVERARSGGDDVPPDPPRVIADRYELGPVVGRGGSATVHRAWDRDGRRAVALKIYPAAVSGPDRVRHDRELHTLAALDHPGLVGVYDAGTDDGRPYLVMQLVEGPSLIERLADGPLPVPDAVEIGRHLASALRYVHAHGITHRDLKPANVLLDGGRRPLLADFGIALLVDTARVTTGDAVVGTAAYMAPEQVRGEPVGPPADIYALGLVLLESITGVRAFPGTSTESVVARLHHGPSVPSALPGGCAALIERMTAPDPDGRPDARGVVGELALVADRVAGTEPPDHPGRIDHPEHLAPPEQPGSARRRSRRPVALALAAAAVLAITGGVVVELTTTPDPARVAVAPAAAPPPVPVAVAPPVVPASAVAPRPAPPVRAASPGPDQSPDQSTDQSTDQSAGLAPADVPVGDQQTPAPTSTDTPPSTDNGHGGDGHRDGGDQNNGSRKDGRGDGSHPGSSDAGSTGRSRSAGDNGD